MSDRFVHIETVQRERLATFLSCASEHQRLNFQTFFCRSHVGVVILVAMTTTRWKVVFNGSCKKNLLSIYYNNNFLLGNKTLYLFIKKKIIIIIQTELVKNKLRKQPVKYSLIGIIFLGGGGLGGGIMETWLFENWLATGRGVGHKGSLFNLSRLSCSSVYWSIQLL